MGTTDCCFTKDNEWFRYRTAAIIVEEGNVLFVQSSGCDYLYTVGDGFHVNETAEECFPKVGRCNFHKCRRRQRKYDLGANRRV